MKYLKFFALIPVFCISNLVLLSTEATAQDKTCILTDAGKKICGKPASSNSLDVSGRKNNKRIVTLDYGEDFRGNHAVNIRLEKCIRKESFVNCRFSIDTTEVNEIFMLLYARTGQASSLIVDDQGEEYIAHSIIIADDTQFLYQRLMLYKNQPVYATLRFKLPEEMNTIPILNFSTHANTKRKIASFSNISISR